MDFRLMSSVWSSLATKPLAEHEIVIFYDIDGLNIEMGPETTFRELAPEYGASPLPPDQLEALQHRYANDWVWRQAEPDEADRTAFKIGGDLHPHIRHILSGARVDLATRWLPTETTTRLLEKADRYEEDKPQSARIRKALLLNYTKAAQDRLAAATVASRELKLTIGEFDLTLFETRKGLLQARVTFSPLEKGSPLTTIEVLEAVYALSRFNSFRWIAATTGHEPVGPEFTLGTLLRWLCFPQIRATQPSGRIFTYLFARFDCELTTDEADLFALYAARHYTTDYHIAPHIEDVRRVRDFITIGHTVSLEGGASVITPPPGGQLPEFLKTWKTHAFRAHYLPILMLALHEHEFLVEKTSTALLTAEQRKDPERVRKGFLDLTRASLIFRIFFRYTEVSEISMHNAFNRALREVLGLDRMLVELSSDVAEISAFLEREVHREAAEAEYRRSTRFWFFAVVGTGILAALSVSMLVKEVLESLGLFVEAWKGPLAVLETKEGREFFGLLAGVIVLIFTCVGGYLKRPLRHGASDGREADGFTKEAKAELIIHLSQGDR
jgi:hypothetical protein